MTFNAHIALQCTLPLILLYVSSHLVRFCDVRLETCHCRPTQAHIPTAQISASFEFRFCSTSCILPSVYNMPSASGVEMWIESEGNVLPEYQVMHHGPTRTVTCYIPSKVGKTFAVGYRVTTGYQDAYVHGLMGIYSYFDGSSECGRIESMRLNDKTTQKIDSIRVSLKEEKLLTFSDIQLTGKIIFLMIEF